MTDSTALLARAASGDAGAQMEIALVVVNGGRLGLISMEEALSGAEMPCRMAAARGGTTERLVLAGLLLARSESLMGNGNSERGAAYMDEAQTLLGGLSDEGCLDAAVSLAALLETRADEGDEIAADNLNLLSGLLPAATLKGAAELSRALRQISEGR